MISWGLRASVRARNIKSFNSIAALRSFSTPSPRGAENRIYTNVRTPDELSTLLLLSSSSRQSLITLWTISGSSSCSAIAPLVKSLIEDEGVGEKEGGVGYAEVEMDAVTIGDLQTRYMINSIPTLLAFSRSEPQLKTKGTRLEDLKSKKFLTEWIENEARRGGKGGAGGSLFDWFTR